MDIRGLRNIETDIFDGQLFWRFEIRNPFELADNKFRVGINDRAIEEAQKSGVSKFIIQVGKREIEMRTPDKKVIKRKIKAKEFELKDSIFADSKPYRIFHFLI